MASERSDLSEAFRVGRPPPMAIDLQNEAT